MANPEVQNDVVEQGIENNSAISEFVKMVETGDSSEINKELNKEFFDKLKDGVNDFDTANQLKTAIENVDGYEEDGTPLNDFYKYITNYCDSFDSEGNVKNKVNSFDDIPRNKVDKKLIDNIIKETNYLILSNTSEIKVNLFGVKPEDVVLEVGKSENTDNERTKQVIKALKEPGEPINGSGSKSIQDLQILMGKTLGIRLNPDGKFGKDTFGAMKKYLSGETVTAKNANEANNTRVNASDVMFGNEKLPIQNENGKNFVEIDGNKYYEYEKGMNGLGYQNGINKNSIEYTYIGNYVNGYWEGNGTITRANGDKYEGKFKNNEFEGKGTATRANGNKYEGEWKNGNREGFGTFTDSDGNKYEGEYKNDKCEGKGTATRADGDKYEGDWKDGKRHGNGTMIWYNKGKYDGEYEGEYKDNHAEGQGKYTWANGKSVEGTFVKSDKSNYGLATPKKFYDDSGEYDVIRDSGLLKITTEGVYKGKYISFENGNFVDAPSTNHDSDQENDQADNPKDNNVDNHASKQREQFKKYQKLNEEIQKLRNGGSYEYKINDDIIFTFTKEKCILNDSGKEITFYNASKKGIHYRIKPNKYITIKPNFIDIYDISKNMNKLYYQDGSGRKKFEGYTDKYGNPKEGIMTYNNGSKFEGNFIVGGTVKEGERHNVNFKEDDFWNNVKV